MTREEIINRFRQENPEITANVASDAVLESWCEVGNLEICTTVRLVKGEATIPSITGTREYNLEQEITKFYDIDELPGGGVAYNNKRLDMISKAQLDEIRPSWRADTSNGTPKYYYRRGSSIFLDKPASSVVDIDIDTVLIPDPLDDDNKTPFNELPYLEPFHYSLVLYLKMRVFKGKVKKVNDAQMAQDEYTNYIDWMKQEVNRGIYSNIKIRPPVNYRGTRRYPYR